jgi:hypothetical protein
MSTVGYLMLQLLDSVPWFVISAFVGSAVLAVAAGRRSGSGTRVVEAGVTTRVFGFFYALSVAAVAAMWIKEQVR